jgi:hypothetical protein
VAPWRKKRQRDEDTEGRPSLEEARRLLSMEEACLRSLSYDELLKLQEPIVKELRGQHGYVYSVEIQSFWDSKKEGDLRVILAMAAWWGWGIVTPQELMADFIMAPDGTFIGE